MYYESKNSFLRFMNGSLFEFDKENERLFRRWIDSFVKIGCNVDYDSIEFIEIPAYYDVQQVNTIPEDYFYYPDNAYYSYESLSEQEKADIERRKSAPELFEFWFNDKNTWRHIIMLYRTNCDWDDYWFNSEPEYSNNNVFEDTMEDYIEMCGDEDDAGTMWCIEYWNDNAKYDDDDCETSRYLAECDEKILARFKTPVSNYMSSIIADMDTPF